MDLITDQLIMNYLNLNQNDIEDIQMVRKRIMYAVNKESFC